MTKYFEHKWYIKDEETYKEMKKLIIDFGTGDEAAKAIIRAYKSGLLKTTFL